MFPPWHCVNINLHSSDHTCWWSVNEWLAAPGCDVPSNSWGYVWLGTTPQKTIHLSLLRLWDSARFGPDQEEILNQLCQLVLLTHLRVSRAPGKTAASDRRAQVSKLQMMSRWIYHQFSGIVYVTEKVKAGFCKLGISGGASSKVGLRIL